jgi:hypothetical protein
MQAAFVGDLARFEIKMRRWVRYGESASCQYYARLDAEARGELILNSGSSSDECTRRGGVSVTRHRPDQVVVSLSGLKEIPKFTLDEKIRPLGEDERATLPENFDILGVSLGMTRAEIEKNLIEGRGFVLNPEYDYLKIEETNWIVQTVIYHRGTANDSVDEITVVYSARRHHESTDKDQGVMVRRRSHLGQMPNLNIDILRGALTRKYGVPTKGNDRRYGRDGQLVRNHDDRSQFCEPGTRRNMRDLFFDDRRVFSSHCGSELKVKTRFDDATGFVEEYVLTFSSVDYLNNGEWSKRAIDLEVEIEAFLQAIEGAETSGPEL